MANIGPLFFSSLLSKRLKALKLSVAEQRSKERNQNMEQMQDAAEENWDTFEEECVKQKKDMSFGKTE